MAICMMCHRKIPNGKRFCDECETIRKQQADESYLDSLLSSVSSKKPENNNKSKDFTAASSPASTAQSKQAVIDDASDTKINPEMDEMLNDLFSELDESSFGDGTDEAPETDIGADDLAAIFDEAENSVNNNVEAAEPEISEDDGLFDNISVFPSENDLENEYEATLEAEPETEHKTEQEISGFDFDTSGLGPGDLAILNGQENSVVDIDWASNSSDVVVDSDIDALFEEVPADQQNSEYDGEDLNTILGLNNNDDELDKIMNDISNGDFNKHEDDSDSDSEIDLEEDEDKSDKKPKKNDKGPKKSFWKRLFGNILDKSPEEILEDEKKEEEDRAAKKEKAEQDKQKAEENKKRAAEEKARQKAEAEIRKKEADARNAAKKAEEKEKAKKKKEEALALAEFEVEHGRINRAGATILFIIFAILTVIIIIGTNIYSYNLSIANAEEDFNIQKYNEAYYEVYGLNIQDEDIVLYDRIMTVMYVNTQLNSYEYYMTSNNEEKALDSLLKGLEKYDKYYSLASALDISDDLDYVRDEILFELEEKFNLTKEEAYNMIVIDDSIDYSDSIYGLLGSYDELSPLIDK